MMGCCYVLFFGVLVPLRYSSHFQVLLPVSSITIQEAISAAFITIGICFATVEKALHSAPTYFVLLMLRFADLTISVILFRSSLC